MESDQLRKRKSEEIALAPKRPPKASNLPDKKDKVFERPLFSEPKKEVKNEEDSFNLSDLSPNKEDKKCFICNKPLSHLSEARRRLHINSCLDIQETIRKQETAEEKHENTMDCPICQTPYPQGPHRIAHIKSCGKKHAISGSKLLDMVETQEKVTAVRKSNKVNHTKAPRPKVKPVTAPKLSGQPKSINDEQLLFAKALSNSLKPPTSPPNSIEAFKEGTPEFTRIPDPIDKRKKRPKSFALVEFAPRTCQCQVLSAVQTRFVNAFKSAVRATKEEDFTATRIDSQAKYQLRLVEKTNRFERLADDFSLLFNNGTGADVHITCGDGVIPAHKTILLARTRGFVKNEATIRMAEPKEIVTSWLRFIYTARVEWSPGQEDAIQALAQKYGPDSLLHIAKKKTAVEQPVEKSIPTISEDLNECILEPSTSAVESQLTETTASVSIQETNPSKSKSDVYEDTICGILDGTNPNDGEDPMQGINLSVTTDEGITEEIRKIDKSDECVLLLEETIENNITPCNEPAMEEAVTPISRDYPHSPDIFDSRSSEEPLNRTEIPQPWHMTPIVLATPTPSMLSETDEEPEKKKDSPVLDSIEEVQNECFDYPIDEANDYGQWDVPDYQSFHVSPEQPSTSRAQHISSTTSFLRNLTPSQKFETPRCSKKRTSILRLSSTRRAGVDSFDNSVDLIPKSPAIEPTSKENWNMPPLATSTPIQPNKKLKFGSNVKIIKTTGITPMPNYGAMDEARLKIELGLHGLRPMGKKRAVAKLIEIYESVHPQIDPSTPTIRPLDPGLPGVKEVDEDELLLSPRRKINKVKIVTPTKKTVPPVVSSESSPSSDHDDLGDKTLNSERDEPAEESMIDDPTSLPKNIDEMKAVFLKWLRKKENEHLYNHILRLQPVLLEELHLKTSKQDDPVCSIPKKALASILDMLGVTFSLPVTTRGARVASRPGGRGGGRGGGRRK